MKKPLLAMLAAATVAVPALVLAAQNGGGHGPRFEQRFSEMDLDGDGRLTEEEMAAHHAQRFANADLDGDGLLSEQEFMSARQARFQERAQRRFARLDRDGDGRLSQAELDARRPDFSRLDSDGDGAVSLEEMRARKHHRRHGN